MAHVDRDGSLQLLQNQMLNTGRLLLSEAIADHLVFIIIPLTLLDVQGMRGKVKSACLPGRLAFLRLLICFLGFLITGAYGTELQSNEADMQSCICAAPIAREVRDNELRAVAVTIFAAMTTIGVAVAGRIFNLRSIIPTIPAAVPEIQAIPAAVQALPIIPAVQGDNLDDVLARAPVSTRLNSPLSLL